MPLFKPPVNFDFSRLSQWSKWKLTFQRFHSCSKLKDEDGQKQIDSLIYTMGPQAEAVFAQLIMTEAKKEILNCSKQIL